jgi:RHS repeat-associated protein
MLGGKKRSSYGERPIVISRARYYDPKVGRFVTKDPIGFKGGDANLYAYVGANPVNNVDPLGLFQWVNPITYWRDFFGGAGDLYRNYKDMRDANTIGADKYFHCMGHCEAARRGDGGRDASELIGEGREQFDEKVKGDSRSDCNADRAANSQGRNGNPNTPCKQVCGSLRPKGLDPRY